DSDASQYVNCDEGVAALEALNLSGRLDRSVLSTVFELLSQQDQVSIGCKISSSFLRFSGWWRLFFRNLESRPKVAARLVIEVSEEGTVDYAAEAIMLLHTLRILGCKIAVVNAGLQGSTFDFIARLRPDF